MNPAVIWPVAVSVWAGGWVATARQIYVSGYRNRDSNIEPYNRNEAMGWALFWPIWVPVMYLCMMVRAGWRLAARLVFGDLRP